MTHPKPMPPTVIAQQYLGALCEALDVMFERIEALLSEGEAHGNAVLVQHAELFALELDAYETLDAMVRCAGKVEAAIDAAAMAPLNDADLPFGNDIIAPPRDPDPLTVLGTVRAALKADAYRGAGDLHWQDIEVRIDEPLSVEIGGYVLLRKEVEKLRHCLDLALHSLALPERCG